MMETPLIMNYAAASNTYGGNEWLSNLTSTIVSSGGGAAGQIPQPSKPNQPKESFTMRITKVFIADCNENLPLESRLLYTGEEKLTDLTDQELFFEVPIKELLDKHNALRAKTIDKKQAEKFGRDIFLEPARIRDLKMTVVDVAKF